MEDDDDVKIECGHQELDCEYRGAESECRRDELTDPDDYPGEHEADDE